MRKSLLIPSVPPGHDRADRSLECSLFSGSLPFLCGIFYRPGKFSLPGEVLPAGERESCCEMKQNIRQVGPYPAPGNPSSAWPLTPRKARQTGPCCAGGMGYRPEKHRV
ncbi:MULTISPECIES: hypothetical protein [unclassified Rhizobium]|uniref:hypothetical protein n=1 Tax=unclassified Rhizobium TaxID=2613769 RepID=UPI00161008F6|nr:MULTISPECIES: hypothetical protein [unclassified Rhizobium]